MAPEGVDKEEDKREPLFPGVTLCSPVMADSSTPNLTLDHGAPRTGDEHVPDTELRGLDLLVLLLLGVPVPLPSSVRLLFSGLA